MQPTELARIGIQFDRRFGSVSFGAEYNCRLIAAMDDIAKAHCFCKNGRDRQPFG